MICGYNHCKGELEYNPGDSPYSIEHWVCPKCYSTYNLDQRKKNAYALPHDWFRDMMEKAGVNDSTVEQMDWGIIEIMGEQDITYMPWVFTKDHPNVLRLMFDDIDEPLKVEYFDSRMAEQMYPMNEEQGRQIVEFVRRNEHQKKFIVHCAAGISRSGAVAEWIMDYFGGSYDEFKKANPYTVPNKRIVSILKRQYDELVPRTDTGSPEGHSMV